MDTEPLLYNACGNIIGIYNLQESFDEFNIDKNLRSSLVTWGKKKDVDSIMLLTGDSSRLKDQGYHVFMYVFEPNGTNIDNPDYPGAISTMCGNGIRAVASYISEKNPQIQDKISIMTLSGLLTIKHRNGMYEVQMGTATSSVSDLSQYVNSKLLEPNAQNNYIDSLIPKELLHKLRQFPELSSIKTFSIGLTGNRNTSGIIDGEPHVVIQVPKEKIKDINELRSLAIKAGPLITKNLNFFPKEINVNFISKVSDSVILNCTHERNLGDNAEHSVTAACGTGSTFSGATIMYNNPKLQSVKVKCLGGELIIENNDGYFYMIGPACKC